MMTAIRKSLRDFIAVVVLIVIAAVTSYFILQQQRLRIPILEEKPFELKAEFETAQAVVAGQGQTLRVAGVRIGDVSKVELEDGNAVVTFDVDREFLPIYKDATLLMRPRTGLKDMFFALDPGTRTAGEYEEGDVVPMTNTAPDVNLDELLAALDGDSQAYLRSLIVGAGQGLVGRDKDLGKMLAALGSDQPGPRRALDRGREARREPEAPDPQPQQPDASGRPAGPGHRHPGRRLEHDARGDRRPGSGRAAGDGAAARGAAPDAPGAGGGRRVRRPARAGVQRAAPVRAQAARR